MTVGVSTSSPPSACAPPRHHQLLAQQHGHGQAHGANGGAHAGNGLRGVTRPRGDAERPREQRRGLWGGELDDAEAEAEPAARMARTDA